jgi:hypothetical protein
LRKETSILKALDYVCVQLVVTLTICIVSAKLGADPCFVRRFHFFQAVNCVFAYLIVDLLMVYPAEKDEVRVTVTTGQRERRISAWTVILARYDVALLANQTLVVSLCSIGEKLTQPTTRKSTAVSRPPPQHFMSFEVDPHLSDLLARSLLLVPGRD